MRLRLDGIEALGLRDAGLGNMLLPLRLRDLRLRADDDRGRCC